MPRMLAAVGLALLTVSPAVAQVAPAPPGGDIQEQARADRARQAATGEVRRVSPPLNVTIPHALGDWQTTFDLAVVPWALIPAALLLVALGLGIYTVLVSMEPPHRR